MPELPNFVHMFISTVQFVNDIMERNYDVITSISKYLHFKKVCSSQFCYHHQNCNHIYQIKFLRLNKNQTNETFCITYEKLLISVELKESVT